MIRFGQKSGKGFYIYDENRKKSSDPEVEELIISFAQEKQIKRRTKQNNSKVENDLASVPFHYCVGFR